MKKFRVNLYYHVCVSVTVIAENIADNMTDEAFVRNAEFLGMGADACEL